MSFTYSICLANIQRKIITRNSIFDLLNPFCERLLVALEYHADMYTVHFHIFMESKSEISKAILEPLLLQIGLKDINIYFEYCINFDSYIKYCTKEDFQVIFKNLDDERFHFMYKIGKWSLENEIFNANDEFIKNNSSHLELMRYRHSKIRKCFALVYPLYEYIILKRFGNWRDNVVNWFNNQLKAENKTRLALNYTPKSMGRKVKDVKKEEINRLFDKYADIVNGKFDMNVHRIMNFTRLVIPTLAEQFKEQTNIRYWCMFSTCFSHQRSYKTKQKYIQHLCLKHSQQLPGKGLFLLNGDENVSSDGFWCSKCDAKVLETDPGFKIIQRKNRKSKTKDEDDSEIICLNETFSTTCSLIDISLDEKVSAIIKEENKVVSNNDNLKMTIEQFWLHDPRCDKRLFYNRIDDDILDIHLYTECFLDTIIDSICQMNKHQKLMDEYQAMFEDEHKTNHDFKIAKKNMLTVLNHSKNVFKELYNEFKEFQAFIQDL
ncbi:unnamed protein product [Brachionus calyciflorus]|uniref:Uncharacterized protein n=1 Tax=Brachionus calyciflorus TaxID=104777 RepID=A0A813V2L8_9BILA|nr:unnamed protein product [Brachionus calyciflorus]